MAKNILNGGGDAEKPDGDGEPKPPPSLSDVAAFSAAQQGEGGETPPAEAAAAAPVVETGPKARTGTELMADVFSALASRIDPLDVDQIRDLVNEPGADGKPRHRAANGPIQAVLNSFADGKKVDVTRPGKGILHYALTSQTRAEIESPAIIRAQREGVVYLVARRLVYQEIGHGPPMPVSGITPPSIALGLVIGSTRSPAADAARAKGDAPTLLGETAYASRQGLTSDPEEDLGEITERVVEHLARLVDAKMIELLPATTGSGKDRYQLTKDGETILFESGLSAVVDTTFPPKPPRPTLEELTKEAEAAAAHLVKECAAEAALMKKHFEEQHARADREKVLREGYEAWFHDHKIEEPEAILRRKSKSIKDRKIDTFEEEVQLNQEEHDRVIDEHAAMSAFLKQSQNEWSAAKDAWKTKETRLTAKLEALMEIIRLKGHGVYLVDKQAYREVVNGEILVFSAEPHEIGRLIGREPLPLGTQLAMPGTKGAQWTDKASTPAEVQTAIDTMLASLNGDASTPAAKASIDKFLADMAAKGVKVTAGTDGKGKPSFTFIAGGVQVVSGSITTPPAEAPPAEAAKLTHWPTVITDPTIAALREPLEAFLKANTGGVTADVVEERFFEFLKLGKPKPEVSAIFVKILAAAVKAKVIGATNGGPRGVLYWHRDNGDPAKVADEGKAPGTTPDSKPKTPPKKKGGSGKD